MDLDHLGPYRLGRKLGRGGMGTVFAGTDVETGEPAAVKMLSATLAREEGFRERFEAEIESLKILKHPNIVRLYGYGEEDGHLFYAMELVDGPSLEEELQAGRRFDWREATSIAVQICRALKHAHDHGVIHRDLKPANLLLGEDEQVKLSDFGIAKLFGTTSMTADGGVIGTAEYMAPEQADGRPVTYRCDLYSLGCVLYTMLAGRPPFRAKSLPEMLQMQRFAQPEPLRRFNTEVPIELEETINQLLEKDPAARFPSATVVARRLEAMVKALSVGEPSPGEVSLPGGEIHGSATREETSPELPSDDSGPGQAGGSDLTVAASNSGGERGDTDHFELADPGTSATSGGEEQAASGAGASIVEELTPSGTERAKSSRFTTVDEVQPLHTPHWDAPGSTAAKVAQGTLLFLALVGTIWFLFWLAQPESADELYERIDQAAAEGNFSELRRMEPEIREFLERFPNDLRCRPLKEYIEEIELQRQERRLRHFQGRLSELAPIERAYLEALDYAAIEPERGLARFQALLDMYPDPDKIEDEKIRQCLALAARRVEQYKSRLDGYLESELAWLKDRLAVAESLTETDPKKARAIYEAVVECYEHKPWASSEVQQAKQALRDTEALAAEAP